MSKKIFLLTTIVNDNVMSVLISKAVNEARYLLYKLILKACKDIAGKKALPYNAFLILIELV